MGHIPRMTWVTDTRARARGEHKSSLLHLMQQARLSEHPGRTQLPGRTHLEQGICSESSPLLAQCTYSRVRYSSADQMGLRAALERIAAAA